MLIPFAAIVMIAGAAPRVPVLVELFTSEGCSSCPPADALLAELAASQPVDGVEIVPMSLHVDYWDDLGWRDPFDSPAFSERQRAYASAFREESIYTPELVIDGDAHFAANRQRAIEAIARAAKATRAELKLGARRKGDEIEVQVAVGKLP